MHHPTAVDPLGSLETYGKINEKWASSLSSLCETATAQLSQAKYFKDFLWPGQSLFLYHGFEM